MKKLEAFKPKNIALLVVGVMVTITLIAGIAYGLGKNAEAKEYARTNVNYAVEQVITIENSKKTMESADENFLIILSDEQENYIEQGFIKVVPKLYGEVLVNKAEINSRTKSTKKDKQILCQYTLRLEEVGDYNLNEDEFISDKEDGVKNFMVSINKNIEEMSVKLDKQGDYLIPLPEKLRTENYTGKTKINIYLGLYEIEGNGYLNMDGVTLEIERPARPKSMETYGIVDDGRIGYNINDIDFKEVEPAQKEYLDYQKIKYTKDNDQVSFSRNPNAVKLAEELMVESNNNKEFIDKVYTYLKEEIEYDNELNEACKIDENVRDGNFERLEIADPDSVLANKKGICSGYSHTLALMLRSQGIPTKIVYGNALQNGVYGAHAWNEVFIEGRWVLLDATWKRSYGNTYTGSEESTNLAYYGRFEF